MPASIAALLRRADLGMTLLSGEGTDLLHAPIRWVTTSELIDPTPYLRGGELLLTTGMRLPASRSAVADYVVRLAGVGAIGIGMGIGQGLAHRTVPPRLIDAADRAGFPLLLVDEPTPFIAIGEAVAQLHLADETAALAQALKAQQSITRAAVTAGPAGVIRQLATLIDGWALVADIAGHVRHEAPEGASATHSLWRAELGRLRGGRSTSAALSDPGGYVTVQNLGDGHRLRGFLVTGRSSRPSTAHHSMTNVAAALLSVASGSDDAYFATEWDDAGLDQMATDHGDPGAAPGPTLGAGPGARPGAALGPRFGEAAGPEDTVILAALSNYQRRSHVSLADSLRAWLQHHGRFRPAAAALGIHRNTLAHRLRRAGELLGRDLDDPAVRAQLWAALAASKD
jgi:purine catabolism regulator